MIELLCIVAVIAAVIILFALLISGAFITPNCPDCLTNKYVTYNEGWGKWDCSNCKRSFK